MSEYKTLQENQTLNLEYQRNKELRKLKEEVENKNKVINELLSRIASLEYEVERLTEENLSLKLENKILKSGVENEREYSYGIR